MRMVDGTLDISIYEARFKKISDHLDLVNEDIKKIETLLQSCAAMFSYERTFSGCPLLGFGAVPDNSNPRLYVIVSGIERPLISAPSTIRILIHEYLETFLEEFCKVAGV